MTTALILVRHGESEANLARFFAGHTDIPLTEKGHLQAENTASFLKDYSISAIYSSDLLRSMQTAAPTARMHDLPVIPERALREVFAGEWEGRAYADLMETYAEGYRIWREDCGRAHPTGGERVTDLASRIYAAVDRIASAHRGECVAIFTHATPIRALTTRWQGLPVEDMKDIAFVPNASVTIVEVDENGNANLRLCGHDAHQGELSTAFKKGTI